MKKTTDKKTKPAGKRQAKPAKAKVSNDPSSLVGVSQENKKPLEEVVVSEEIEVLLRAHPDWPVKFGLYLSAIGGEVGRGNILRACKGAHLSASTVYQWRDKAPSFDKAHRKYKRRGDRLQKARLEEQFDLIAENPYGRHSQPAITAGIVRLKRLDPEYKEGGNQINIQNNNVPPRLIQAMSELLSLAGKERDRLLGRSVKAIPERVSITGPLLPPASDT